MMFPAIVIFLSTHLHIFIKKMLLKQLAKRKLKCKVNAKMLFNMQQKVKHTDTAVFNKHHTIGRKTVISSLLHESNQKIF